MKSSQLQFFLTVLALVVLPYQNASSDVVKPALVEISVYKSTLIEVEVRASIEALLTGINGQYKNTQDAPNAEEYDALRILQATELQDQFTKFQDTFLNSIKLVLDETALPLRIENARIPEPGYTKVPRISIIKLQATAPIKATELTWYYPAAFGDNAVRVRQVDRKQEKWHWSPWQWLKNDQPSAPFSLTEVFASQTTQEVFNTYIPLGFMHILPRGMDHILFVLGLFLFSRRFNPMAWQITMFTLAHTITLGLAAAELVTLPDRLVEPLIALSIAYIGFENIWARRLARYRLILVFLFGLLHGLGFASVLLQFGLPSNSFLVGLIAFNVGVELGQLFIVLVAVLTVGQLYKRDLQRYQRYIVYPASATIAITGLLWTYERVFL